MIYQFKNRDDAIFYFGIEYANSYLTVVDSRKGFSCVKVIAHNGKEFVSIGETIEVFTDEIEKVK